MNLYKSNTQKNSLSKLNPQLAEEWNYEKNQNLTPDMFSVKSGFSVWWKCKNGHEWKATINKRNKQGCPYCSNHQIILGYNDFASHNPQLLDEWNYEKNTDINPYKLSKKSSKKVWWKCKLGHEWQVSIYKRVLGHKCPYCTNKQVKKGYNDLFTIYPNLLEEWDFTRNIDINPYNISAGSNKKVWWKCKNGHYYQRQVYKKIKWNKCPICKKMINL